MNMTATIPAHLVPPITDTTRSGRISWLESLCRHRGGREYEARPFGRYCNGNWLFCFNVKIYSADFTFSNLRNRCIEMGYGDSVCDEPGARELYDAELAGCADNLFDWAIEDARRDYVSDRKSVEDGKPDGDAFSMLWDGTAVDTRFAFMGRSGGWLVFTGFNGHELTTDLMLEELSDADLAALCEIVWFVHQSVAGDKPRLRVEEAAAFTFFNNIAGDVADTLKTEHETALAEVFP